MRVVILGVTTRLGTRLSETLIAQGMTPVGLIRGAERAPRLRQAGVEPVVVGSDSGGAAEKVVGAMTGAGAVVLAAGTGLGPGTPDAPTVMSPAVLLALSAERAGVRRFVLVSAMLPSESDRAALGDDLPAYLREKERAEHAVRERDLDWCVLRPGMLDDSPPTRRILLRSGSDPRPDGPIGRPDLAMTVVEALTAPAAVHKVLAVSSGTWDIRAALARPSP
ncbi:NAD(P)H-binding protein [Streptomyces sp. NPDC020362]|uniref:NAD(P)H-binding protein n=1 Tax=unclassified Streptomyces TaxID=2593676 RepID=UPI0033C67ED3